MKQRLLFNYFTAFLTVFILTSAVADVYYSRRVQQKEPGFEGWICYCDFLVFWIAGHNLNYHLLYSDISEGQYPVYNKNEKFYYFRYSPFAAFLMIPFGRMMHPAPALIIWQIILNILFLSSLLLIGKELYLTRLKSILIISGTFLITLRFYLLNIFHGQTDILMVFLFVLFLMAYVRNKEFFCGIILGFILQFKLSFLPVLVYFLFIGKKRILLSTIISFVALVFVPASALGFKKILLLLWDWGEILNLSISSQLLNYKNQSLVYTIGCFFADNSDINIERLFYVLSTGLTLLAYAFLLRFRKLLTLPATDEKTFKYLEISLLILISLVFSPTTWEAHYINLTIPLSIVIFFTIQTSIKKRKNLYAALGAFIFFGCIFGTDLTAFIPGLNSLRFQNIAVGTVFLAFALIRSYHLRKLEYTSFSLRNDFGKF